jgi:hypothetical protein
MPRTHAHAPREFADGEILGRMFQHPEFELAEEIVAPLCLEMAAELRLPAGTLEEEHELLRHGERNGLAVVLLDERECEVHARGDAGRCVDVAGAYVERVPVHARLRREFREPVEVGPVRRGGAPLEEASRRKQHCAIADRAEALDAARLRREPGEQGRVRDRRFPADAARGQERVGVVHVSKAAGRDEPKAIRHRDGAGARGNKFRRVGRNARATVLGEPARRAREHLQRPGDVEDLRLRETEHHDAMCSAARFRACGSFHGGERYAGFGDPAAVWQQMTLVCPFCQRPSREHAASRVMNIHPHRRSPMHRRQFIGTSLAASIAVFSAGTRSARRLTRRRRCQNGSAYESHSCSAARQRDRHCRTLGGLQDASTPDGDDAPFELYTVAPEDGLLEDDRGLKIQPHYTISNAPQPNVIVVPAHKSTTESRDWLKRASAAPT